MRTLLTMFDETGLRSRSHGIEPLRDAAEARVQDAGTVAVSCAHVAEPVAVRYAFKNYPAATLFNTEGVPASSFRTDAW